MLTKCLRWVSRFRRSIINYSASPFFPANSRFGHAASVFKMRFGSVAGTRFDTLDTDFQKINCPSDGTNPRTRGVACWQMLKSWRCRCFGFQNLMRSAGFPSRWRVIQKAEQLFLFPAVFAPELFSAAFGGVGMVIPWPITAGSSSDGRYVLFFEFGQQSCHAERQ